MENSKSKHKVFIGSSKEGLPIANIVKEVLNEKTPVEAIIWNEDTFVLNKSGLESLLRNADTFDCAVFIFSPDDALKIKGNEKKTSRDNVVFEHGLFLGRMGPRRSFILGDKQVEHFLSDYAGIQISFYDSSSQLNLEKSVAEGCSQIIKAIEAGMETSEFNSFPSTALAIGYFKNYIERTLKALVETDEVFVEGRLYKFEELKINILIPEELGQIGAINLRRLHRKLKKVEMPSQSIYSGKNPIYISSILELESARLEIIDIPETLFTSRHVTKYLIPETSVQRGDTQSRMELREIKNFRNTLLALIAKENFEEVQLKWMSEARHVFK